MRVTTAIKLILDPHLEASGRTFPSLTQSIGPSPISEQDVWHSQRASISRQCRNAYALKRIAEGLIGSFGAIP